MAQVQDHYPTTRRDDGMPVRSRGAQLARSLPCTLCSQTDAHASARSGLPPLTFPRCWQGFGHIVLVHVGSR